MSFRLNGKCDNKVVHRRFIKEKDQLSFQNSTREPAGGDVGYCYFDGAGEESIDCDNKTHWINENRTIVNSHQIGQVRLQDKIGPITTHICRNNTNVNSGESEIQLINDPGVHSENLHLRVRY